MQLPYIPRESFQPHLVRWYAVKLSDYRYTPIRMTAREAWYAMHGFVNVDDVPIQAVMGPFEKRDDVREHFRLARNGACKLTGKSR